MALSHTRRGAVGAASRLLGQRNAPGNNIAVNQPPDSSGGSRGIPAAPADLSAPEKCSRTAAAQLHSGRDRSTAGVTARALHRLGDACHVLGSWRARVPASLHPTLPKMTPLRGPVTRCSPNRCQSSGTEPSVGTDRETTTTELPDLW